MAADKDLPQYDWSARVRTTAREALRYSKFVYLMKRLLSLGAFLIIAAVLAFFFVQRQPRQLSMTYEQLGRIENDLAMVKPRPTGADAKGNPFVITADMAVQDRARPSHEVEPGIDTSGTVPAAGYAGGETGILGQLRQRLEIHVLALLRA